MIDAIRKAQEALENAKKDADASVAAAKQNLDEVALSTLANASFSLVKDVEAKKTAAASGEKTREPVVYTVSNVTVGPKGDIWLHTTNRNGRPIGARLDEVVLV